MNIVTDEDDEKRILVKYELLYQLAHEQIKDKDTASETGKNFQNLIISHLYQLDVLINSYMNTFIPAAEKMDESIQQVNRELLPNVSQQLLDEESQYYMSQTIMQAYVALYHRFESFSTDLNRDLRISRKDRTEFVSYCKRWDLRVSGKGQIYIYSESLEGINWVCNCYKHNDGYPDGEMPLLMWQLDTTKRIEVSKKSLKRHFDFMKVYYQNFFSILPIIQMFFLTRSGEENYSELLVKGREDVRARIQLMKDM